MKYKINARRFDNLFRKKEEKMNKNQINFKHFIRAIRNSVLKIRYYINDWMTASGQRRKTGGTLIGLSEKVTAFDNEV